MRQKIQNKQLINIPGADMTAADNITVFLKQDAHEWTFTADDGVDVVSATQITLTVPYETAMLLLPTDCLLQVCWTEDGQPCAQDPIKIAVGELIAKDGFNPGNDT